MPSSGEDDGKIDHEWAFQPGDLIADEMPQHNRMPGLGAAEPADTDAHDYEVIRRMFDADGGDPMYLVEEPNHDQLVYTASTIRLSFEKVGEVDDDE